MPLSPGTTLGHYRLVDVIGEGGMGVVWRAHDASLGRDVAIKVLPDLLARDAERLARFEREARLLASLQHPGIAAIYGLHEEGEVRFLAMELAEGENLADRLGRGALPREEALRIALAVAEALEAAHERGVIHRDLKPANIMIGGDPGASDLRAGRVKLLDFGLAKAFEGEGVGASPNLSQSPTITAAMTSANVILGTAAYMSPEQARGQNADRRADVWSFGVVLFEMLSGRQLFAGETVSDTLASVLKTELDWAALPADLPPRVRTLLARCLERDRNRRLRDIGEARIALDDELRGAADAHIDAALRSGAFPAAGGNAPAGATGRRSGLLVAGALALGALLALGAAWLLAPPAQHSAPLRKLALGTGEESERMSLPVIAPDGHAVAYLTPTHIVVRELSALETRRFPYEGTIEDLFWSPDGRSLAYILRGRMYRVDALSGQQQVVCEARGSFSAGAGGTWADDGTILFSQADELGFFEVSERGGDPRQVLPADSTKEGDFHDPFILPGKRGVLFVPHRLQDPFRAIELWANGERRVLVDLEGQTLGSPVYSPTGHILFRRSPTNPGIWALPFSLDRLEATGEPFLAAPAGVAPSVSSDGTLVYQEGSAATSLRLTWNDADGREVADAGMVAFQGGYTFPALAPGGQRACASVHDEENPDLWVFDIARGTRTRLTFGAGREEFPVWTPAGDAVLYHVRPRDSNALASIRIMRIAADGTGQPDTLAIGVIPSVSPDGRIVAYSKVIGGGDWDLAWRPLQGEPAQETVFLQAPARQSDPRIAPGGAYVAYLSNESGRDEIYLTRFPGGGGRWQVSVGGGMWPRWSRAGDRLYYAKDDDLMAVDIALGASPTLGTPRLVATRPPISVPTIVAWAPGLDVSGDGARFLYFRDPQTGATEHEILVVQNWHAEFEARK